MVDLRFEPVTDLVEYAGIPSVYESKSVYDVTRVSGNYELVERTLFKPFRKDYDEVENPRAWPSELRRTESVLVSAFFGGQRVGGTIAAIAVPGLLTWVNEPGVAVLWDLRVTPVRRRTAVATSLLRAAEAWAKDHGCIALRVETQNTNVAACKFYMHNGFTLQEVRYGAYPQLPEEVQFIWGKRLDG